MTQDMGFKHSLDGSLKIHPTLKFIIGVQNFMTNFNNTKIYYFRCVKNECGYKMEKLWKSRMVQKWQRYFFYTFTYHIYILFSGLFWTNRINKIILSITEINVTVPSTKQLLFRIFIEITGCLILSGWLAYIFIFATDASKEDLQFKRGFFCSDESLKHPTGTNNLLLIKIYTRGHIVTHTSYSLLHKHPW